MAKRKRRAFTKEFKAQAVRIVRESGKSVGTVARELDLTETALRSWVRQADVDADRGAPGALTTEEREELGRLRRENRTLRMERDILKKRRPSSRRRIREVRVHRRGEGHLPRTRAVSHAPGLAGWLLRVAAAAAGAACARGRASGAGDRGDPCREPAPLRQPVHSINPRTHTHERNLHAPGRNR
jgi:transposase